MESKWKEPSREMKKIESAGFLVFKNGEKDKFKFLLLRKYNGQNDLPKGELEPGETPLDAAKRELSEETSISTNYIIDENFIYEETYFPFYKRFVFLHRLRVVLKNCRNRFNEKIEKKLTVFLGKLLIDQPLKMTEHGSFEWIDYNPPHKFHWPPTLNKLFRKLSEYEKTGKLANFLNKEK